MATSFHQPTPEQEAADPKHRLQWLGGGAAPGGTLTPPGGTLAPPTAPPAAPTPPAPTAPPAAPAAPAPPAAPAAPAAPAPATPAAPAGGIDPAQAQKQLLDQFQAKFGRAMSPAEQAEMQKRLGYTPGGAITADMMRQGGSLISQYTGSMSDYGPDGTVRATPGGPQQTTNALAQQTLQDILKQGDTFDPNNPAARAQRSQFDKINSRETGRTRLAAAERAAAGGTLGSGGFDADVSAAEQAQGDRSSQFESQLMTQELGHQRQKVQHALALAVQSGDANAARQLQEKLGTMDLELRGKLGKGQLGLGYLNAMLGDKQAGNALGLGYFNAQNSANQSLLNSLLGGM